jgi:predicted solute-binding protein
VCAVSYLNTVPLVWGILHGPQRESVELEFALPSDCADRLRDGRADIGLPPVAALLDQNLAVYRGAGIACKGPVRTILLVSRVPFEAVRTLATDLGSRTSVLLARIVLAQNYGVTPVLTSMTPELASMLDTADAALVIGDAALRLDPAELRTQGLHVADLGEEWVRMTGLPMVFAVWAGDPCVWSEQLEQAFVQSAEFGLTRLDDIARSECAARGVPFEVAHDYLRENIIYELGTREYEGMDRFLQLAKDIGPHQFEPEPLTVGD